MISVDGHPVRGAFTFAVGPNPGPAPQFVIPSISETAATPRLLIARWIVFLSLLAAIGLFGCGSGSRDRSSRRVPGTSLRPVSIAFWVAAAVALIAIPVYVVLATADFALRSAFDLGALMPLLRASAFGRGFLDLELCLALFAVAAAIALYVDRPMRTTRSVAELLALVGATLAAAAALIIPGAAGHAAQTAPRALARCSTLASRRRRRSGSGACSACSCSGGACPRRCASPVSPSSCRASRTSPSSQ